MQALISSEFLIEPAFADKNNLQKSVDDIIKINKMVNNDYHVDVVTQNELLDKLIQAKLYPSEGVFKQNLYKYDLEDEISSQDIVTMIHNIMQRSVDLSSYTDIFEIEYGNVDVTPRKESILSRCCIDSLIYDFLMASIINSSRNQNLNLIFGRDNQVNSYNLKTDEVVLYCADQTESLHNVDNKLATTKSVDDFLLFIGADVIWNGVNNMYSLSLAIYTKVLELRRDSGKTYDNEFTLDCFNIGDGFMDSLIACQCIPNSRFGSTCFEAIARLIEGNPKESLNEFRVDSGKNAKQRTRGNDLAFRTHVTKGNEGIRLMVWRLPTGIYELANVGNKFDLDIQD